MKGGSHSVAIAQLASNGFVAMNKITGSGPIAFRAESWRGIKSNGNTFAWNDVREFKASAADFLCGGNKNTIIGAKCKVVDKGKENRILVMQ